MDGLPDAVARQSAPSWGGMTVQRILKILDSSKYLRDIKDMENAKTSFKKLILKDDAPDTFIEHDTISYTTLRHARVNADALACVLYRMLWLTFDPEDLYIFLFVDASPQYRGRELFAASMDLMVGSMSEHFERKLLPQVRIGIGLFTALGKVVALLWQIWLTVGPDYAQVRLFFCNSVLGMCTDLGTERLIPRHADVLLDFYTFLRAPIPRWASRQQYLFPSALVIIGWQHTWDGLLRWALCSLAFSHSFYDD